MQRDRMSKKKTDHPFPSADLARLRSLVAHRGERAAFELIGCARLTLARALGGLPISAGTAALIREKLAAVATTEPTP